MKNVTVFLYQLFTNDISMENILKEQYYLCKHSNISLSDSNKLTEFERHGFINMIIEDLNREAEEYNKKPSFGK